MKKGASEKDIFLVKCISDSIVGFREGKSYRAMFATEHEFETRGIWIWIETDTITAHGFGQEYFYKKFMDKATERSNKLIELGI